MNAEERDSGEKGTHSKTRTCLLESSPLPPELIVPWIHSLTLCKLKLVYFFLGLSQVIKLNWWRLNGKSKSVHFTESSDDDDELQSKGSRGLNRVPEAR